jgi:amino acid transporter
LHFRHSTQLHSLEEHKIPAAIPSRTRRQLSLLPLIAITFFMVSGGPYGLEDAIGQAGYLRTLLLLAVLPILWSLPTALMIGELAAALPAEGGFYIWVRRALGPFWGFQEAWLSLAASIFDMALYPKLFVLYLGQLVPQWTAGNNGIAWSLAVILLCVAWNLRGSRSVGRGSIWMGLILLAPFACIVIAGIIHASGLAGGPLGIRNFSAPTGGSFTTALLVVLWNLMGWDNASTIAQEVEKPQRNYIRAMLGAVVLVSVSYLLPVAAVAFSGMPAARFATGAWVDAATALTHWPWLGWAVTAGGALTGIAMFNALTLSYAHLPAAMANDGILPRALAKKTAADVPWVSLLCCTAAWAACLGFSFDRLIELDVTLYGLSLFLEFVALLALRLREPQLPRPFRIPGGTAAVAAIGIPPAALIAYAIFAARHDQITGIGNFSLPAIWIGIIVVFLGPLLWLIMHFSRAKRT